MMRKVVRRVKYIGKMKAKSKTDNEKEIERLSSLVKAPMKPELKQWTVARMNILKQLVA